MVIYGNNYGKVLFIYLYIYWCSYSISQRQKTQSQIIYFRVNEATLT
jgi:hypothetical protein